MQKALPTWTENTLDSCGYRPRLEPVTTPSRNRLRIQDELMEAKRREPESSLLKHA